MAQVINVVSRLGGAAAALRHGLVMAVCGVGVLVVAPVRAQQTRAQPSTSGGVFTEAQATRGDALYMENCAQCHRFDLTGGDQAPPLVGPAFTVRWTTTPLSQLFDYMRAEMPLNSPGGLSAEQNADLLAFMLKRSGYAAGRVELPAASEKLAALKLQGP